MLMKSDYMPVTTLTDCAKMYKIEKTYKRIELLIIKLND